MERPMDEHIIRPYGRSKIRPDIDRGWAWVVMAAVYMGMMIYCITLYMNGVLYLALLDKYGGTDVKASLVGAFAGGLLCFLGPVAGILNNLFSCRFSIVLGGVFTSVGFASSAFVPSLDWVIFTAGVLVGTGYGMSSSGIICSLGFYFKRYQNQALSCAFLVVGVAMFVSAPLGLYLIDKFGLSQAFLILASVQLQMCVVGVICRPSTIEQDVRALKNLVRKKKTESLFNSYLDFSLLTNKAYFLFLLSTSAWNFALTSVHVHLPNYVFKLGGQSHDISLIMIVFSVANTIGRLLGSFTVTKGQYKAIYVHLLVLVISGVATSLFMFYSKEVAGIYIFTSQLGLFTGWPNAMMTPLSLSFVGITKLSEAYGLAYLFCGIGVSTGPVLIGYLYSMTGSYEYSFITAGVVLILGSLSGFGAMCCRTDGHNKPAVYSIDVEGEKLEEEELTVVDNHVTPDRSGLSASGTRIYGHDETCEQGQPLVGEKNEIKSHFS
ncbi:monocarboxylate transporter 13-like isoform X1 [Mya arenaria]|uniref:monocarboxylate transporter 13-like isoform X1 n=1 Tax=Mya arenaria TaxID=6604 RepID=UPI0022E34F90|nr:monocarboxylate transporter 13-like isoform X1 [Mya arenaria]XP_052784452.1 monocarboxylate transporter 13-like isoform X1 [Mya arenaria]XP_052784453.1 monocarboxylate transporter 13-like isoform X1 [Mya arenaria]